MESSNRGSRGKYHQYTEEVLEKAIECVKSKELSLYAASKKFQVPKITLLSKVQNQHPGNVGAKPVISAESERKIADWVIECAKKGDPRTKDDVLRAAIEFDKFENDHPRFSENGPSKIWFKGFMERHPDVSFRVPEQLGKASAIVCEEDVDRFFGKFYSWLESENLLHLLDRADAFINLDETSFELNVIPKRVLAKKGSKTVYNVNNTKQHDNVTVTFSFNAAGEILMPQVIFKTSFTGLQEVCYSAGLTGTKFFFVQSQNGWQTQETFFEYVKKLSDELMLKGVERPVIIFCDGHASHINYHLYEWCRAHGIIIVLFYPNCTHILQMCDVAVFGPAKTGWRREVINYKREHKKSELDHSDFITILSRVMKQTMTPETIKNGFRATGIYPFNSQAIHRERILGTQNTSSTTATVDDHTSPLIEQQHDDIFYHTVDKQDRDFIQILKEN